VRSRHVVIGLVSVLLVSSALMSACGGSTPATPTAPTQLESPAGTSGSSPVAAPEVAPDEVMVGAGDIARCGVGDAEATAKLLDRIPGTVFTLGDNVQDQGAAEEYEKCFEPTWGRHRSRMLPTVGNHDWFGGHGRPYFSYFGAIAGPAGLGYYATTVGAWHVISLNSEISAGSGSPQYEWLKAQLAMSTAACTVAMWHRPLFTSGPNDPAVHMRDAWRLLNQQGAELVLSGHNHQYERFAPQDADGRPDPRGMRQFVVGTGGYTLYGRTRAQANSEAFHSDAWGVLKLTLKSASYTWEFVPVAGQSFRDSGSGTCIPR
jgi:acid phosphatase type 7